MPADTFFEWMRAKYVRDIWEARIARLQERVECEREHRLQHVELQLKAERERAEARALAEKRKEALVRWLERHDLFPSPRSCEKAKEEPEWGVKHHDRLCVFL